MGAGRRGDVLTLTGKGSTKEEPPTVVLNSSTNKYSCSAQEKTKTLRAQTSPQLFLLRATILVYLQETEYGFDHDRNKIPIYPIFDLLKGDYI